MSAQTRCVPTVTRQKSATPAQATSSQENSAACAMPASVERVSSAAAV